MGKEMLGPLDDIKQITQVIIQIAEGKAEHIQITAFVSSPVWPSPVYVDQRITKKIMELMNNGEKTLTGIIADGVTQAIRYHIEAELRKGKE